MLIMMVAWAVASMGCADPDPCNVDGMIVMTYAASQYSDEELAAFPQAVVAWNAATGHEVLRLNPDEEATTCTVHRVTSVEGHLAKSNKQVGEIVLPTTYDCGHTSWTPAECFRAMLTHEAGHMIGLNHVDDRTAVMFHQAESWTPNETDRAECVAAGL
jgi:hypothetical protein